MDTNAIGRLAAILLLAVPALPAQLLNRIDPNNVTLPGALQALVTDPISGGVLAIDTAGATFTWDYGGTGNALTQINPANAAVAGLNVQLCSRGTGATGLAFAWDGTGQQAFQHFDAGWLPLATTNPPSPRSLFALVGLPNGDVLLFGGQDPAGNPLGDTHRLSGNTWQLLTPATSPAPRVAMGATFDGVGMTIFGGVINGPLFGVAVADTWQFNGTNWVNLGLTGPPARFLTSMAFRQRDNEIVMVGGLDNGPIADAWFLRGGTWFPITNGTFNPTISQMSAAYDMRHDEVVAVDWGASPTQVFTNSVSGGINVSAGCPCGAGMLPMGLAFGGTARIGFGLNISFFNTQPNSFVFLAFGTTVLAPPVQIPGFPVGCNAIAGNIQGTVGSASGGTVNVPIPSSVGLIGLRVVYQAVDFNSPPGFNPCVSDAVDVRIGR